MKHEDDWRQTLGPDPLPSARGWFWAICVALGLVLGTFVFKSLP